MKYVITESQLDRFIEEYLNNNYTPKYWGEKDFNYFKKDLDRYGYIDFFDSETGKTFFYYFDERDEEIASSPSFSNISIKENVLNNLNSLFGDLWEKPFIRWFETNTNLPVKNLRISKANI